MFIEIKKLKFEVKIKIKYSFQFINCSKNAFLTSFKSLYKLN